MRKDSFVKFHFKASTGFSVNRPNFAQKSSSLALNTREFHEDYKEIPGFALGNTEIKKMRKKKSGLHPGVSWSPGDRMKPGDTKNLMVSLDGKGGVTRSPGHN